MENSHKTPSGWIHIKLGEYLTEVGERNATSGDNGVPVLSVTNRPGFMLSEEQFDKKVFSKDLSNYKIIQKGQFAYNPSRVNIGSIARLTEFDSGLLSPMYVAFEVRAGLDGAYLDYWIKSPRFRNLVKASTQGSVRNSLNFSALADFPFDLPPVSEQKKITAILSIVDSVSYETQAVIDQAQVLKKGLMQELFTHGILGMHKKFKKTELGEIPDDWSLISLHDLSVGGISNGIFKKKDQYGKGTLLVNVLDTYKALCVNPNRLDRVDATRKEIENYGLNKYDLVFVRSSLKYEGIGQCCMIDQVPEPMLYECHLMRIRPDQTKINPLYLAYYCNSPMFKRSLFTNAKIQTMTTLGQKDLGPIMIPLPQKIEQEKIAEVLLQSDRKIEQDSILKSSALNIKSALMQILLAGEVRIAK